MDTITVKDDNIVFTPKKSLRAEITCKLKTCFTIKIVDLGQFLHRFKPIY